MFVIDRKNNNRPEGNIRRRVTFRKIMTKRVGFYLAIAAIIMYNLLSLASHELTTKLN